MKIIDLPEKIESSYFVCLEEWNKELNDVKSMKEKWYRKMKGKGLRIKVAITDKNIPAGMIEYMPTEYACVSESRSYIINCIWVHGYTGKGYGNMQGRGIGTKLLQAAEEDVNKMGLNGLAAWGLSEKIWMSAHWFEKHDYKKVDQIGWFVLLWKSFNPKSSPPKWIKSQYKQELIPGKVKITSFFSGQCCSENHVYHCAKKAAKKYGDEVVFEEIDMSKNENRKKYGYDWRLYINGENLFTGQPPSFEQINAKIKQHLKRSE